MERELTIDQIAFYTAMLIEETPEDTRKSTHGRLMLELQKQTAGRDDDLFALPLDETDIDNA